jgi:hypothetical protein
MARPWSEAWADAAHAYPERGCPVGARRHCPSGTERDEVCVLISRSTGATLPHDSATIESDRRVSRLGRRVRFAPDTTVAFRCFERHVCTHDSRCAASKGAARALPRFYHVTHKSCPVLVGPIRYNTTTKCPPADITVEMMWSRPRYAHAHPISISL